MLLVARPSMEPSRNEDSDDCAEDTDRFQRDTAGGVRRAVKRGISAHVINSFPCHPCCDGSNPGICVLKTLLKQDLRAVVIRAEHPEFEEALKAGVREFDGPDGTVNPRLHLVVQGIVATQLWGLLAAGGVGDRQAVARGRVRASRSASTCLGGPWPRRCGRRGTTSGPTTATPRKPGAECASRLVERGLVEPCGSSGGTSRDGVTRPRLGSRRGARPRQHAAATGGDRAR